MKRVSGKLLPTMSLAATAVLTSIGASASELRVLEDLLPALDRLSSGLRGTVGIAMVNLPKYSGSDEMKLRALPLVHASYKDTVYFAVKRGGVWLYKNPERAFRAGLVLEPRGGRDASDGQRLIGTADRSTSWEAGLLGEWQFNGMGTVEVEWLTDVSGNSEGDAISVSVAMPFYKTAKSALQGAVKAEWLSENITDYLYGVTASEALATRPQYSPGGTINYSVALHGQYELDHHWRLYTGVRLVYLGDEAADSPIVVDRLQKIAYLGMGWGF